MAVNDALSRMRWPAGHPSDRHARLSSHVHTVFAYVGDLNATKAVPVSYTYARSLMSPPYDFDRWRLYELENGRASREAPSFRRTDTERVCRQWRSAGAGRRIPVAG